MITLHHISIRDFKSLRSVDLIFPPNASVLIEGFNESGKSSLFEAVIFALYGELLVTEETGAPGRGRAVNAIRYGDAVEAATVRLTFAVGATELTVERVLRKRGQTTASLEVRHGAAYEQVRGQTEVSRRILDEMGNLTKDALLNSCFVEQKQLGKLEDMDRDKRQEALEQLLNLGKLGKLQRGFEVTRDETGALTVAEDRLRFAEQTQQLQARASEIAAAQRTAQTLALAQLLADRAATRAELARWQTEATTLAAERDRHADADARLRAITEARVPLTDLHDAQRRRDQLARDRAQLAEGIARCDMAETQEIPRLTARLSAIADVVAHSTTLAELQRLASDYDGAAADLDERANEIAARQEHVATLALELAEDAATIDARAAALATEAEALAAAATQAEQQGTALAALEASRATLQSAQSRRDLAAREVAEWEGRQRLAQSAEQEIAHHRATLAALTAQEAEHATALAAAQAGQRNATERDALDRWLRGADEAAHLTTLHAAQTEAQRLWQVAQAEAEQQDARARAARVGVIVPAVGAAVALVAAIAVVVLGAAWGAALLVVTAGLGVLTYRAVRGQARLRAQASAARIAAMAAQNRVTQAQAEENAWRTFGGGKLRDDAERSLTQAEIAIPVDPQAARQRLATLSPPDGTLPEWATRVAAAQDALTQTRSQRIAADAQRGSAERRRADMGDVDTEGVRVQSALTEAETALAAASDEVARHAAILGIAPDPADIAAAQAAHAANREQIQRAQGAIPARQQALDERRTQFTQRQREHAEQVVWLAEAQGVDHAADQVQLAQQRAAIADEIAVLQQAIALESQRLALAPELPILHAEKGAVERDLAHQHEIARGRAGLLEGLAANDRAVAEVAVAAAVAWAALRVTVPELALDADPPRDASALDAIDARLADLRASWDIADGTHKLSEIEQQLGTLSQQRRDAEQRIAALGTQIAQMAQELGLTGDEAALAAQVPAPAAPAQMDVHHARIAELDRAQYALQSEHAQLAQSLAIAPDAVLDYAACAQAAADLRHEIAVKRRAFAIAETVRRRMIAKVLPQTTQNMRQLLPLLTLDRYHDCEITPDYKLLIYDEGANRPVAKNVFSGGARDQFSLALRLAFALATLPQELGTTPGFIFLDEPLSSFDGPRSEALVNLLTRGQIHDNFSQIFVISHNLLFDRSAFTHHLRLEYGAVVESTLPSA